MTDEDLDALAAEYALGTLDAGERDQAEQLIATDEGFAARVAGWERRLGALEAMVEPVEPPEQIWPKIRDALGEAAQTGEMRLPDVASPVAQGRTAEVVVLSQRVRRWRAFTGITGALAAALLLAIGLGRYRPQWLPPALQPPVRVVERVVEHTVERVVEVPKPVPASGRFVAVLQKDANAPAFLLTVDLDKRTLTARRVGATPEAGKSYELWLVSSKFPAPRSLGLIGAGEFTQPATLASYDKDTIDGATYAVSLEPQGGSPTGAPTGPVLFTGKLVEATPATP